MPFKVSNPWFILRIFFFFCWLVGWLDGFGFFFLVFFVCLLVCLLCFLCEFVSVLAFFYFLCRCGCMWLFFLVFKHIL